MKSEECGRAITAVVVPKLGQLVQVRRRNYVVQDVDSGAVEPAAAPWRWVRLEAVDDDQIRETLNVIWEHEVRPVVHKGVGVPRPESRDPLKPAKVTVLGDKVVAITGQEFEDGGALLR